MQAKTQTSFFNLLPFYPYENEPLFPHRKKISFSPVRADYHDLFFAPSTTGQELALVDEPAAKDNAPAVHTQLVHSSARFQALALPVENTQKVVDPEGRQRFYLPGLL